MITESFFHTTGEGFLDAFEDCTVALQNNARQLMQLKKQIRDKYYGVVHLVVAVREVETCHVHASGNHFLKHVHRPT